MLAFEHSWPVGATGAIWGAMPYFNWTVQIKIISVLLFDGSQNLATITKQSP
jgi:hypothetical protein